MLTRGRKRQVGQSATESADNPKLADIYEKIGFFLERQDALARENKQKRNRLENKLVKILEQISADHDKILEISQNQQQKKNLANKIIEKLNETHKTIQLIEKNTKIISEFQKNKYSETINPNINTTVKYIQFTPSFNQIKEKNIQFTPDFYDFSIDNFEDKKLDGIYLTKNTFYDNGRFKDKQVTEFVKYILDSARFADYKILFDNPSFSLQPYYTYQESHKIYGVKNNTLKSKFDLNPLSKIKYESNNKMLVTKAHSVSVSDKYIFNINVRDVREKYKSATSHIVTSIYPPLLSDFLKTKRQGQYNINLKEQYKMCIQTIIGLIFDINLEFQLRGKRIVRYDKTTGNIFTKNTENPTDIYHTFNNIEYFYKPGSEPPEYYYDEKIGYFKIYPDN